MAGFLFHDVIFGPVRSRRLGLSLGINLLPLHRKHCSFNCIYCECGWTKPSSADPPGYPSRAEVAEFLEKKLLELSSEQYYPDSLTYAGNGEPTLHPQFAEIVDDTINLRDRLMPNAKISVLSNASMTGDEKVFNALLRIDNNIQKLDAGEEKMFRMINQPLMGPSFGDIVKNLIRFDGRVIIQSMFLRGEYKGEIIDNTVESEIVSWLEHLRKIRPSGVMIYPIARETPAHHLEKVSSSTLVAIAQRVRELGIHAEIY
jgi:wyosine [tRNA(Phe)-imidazoG37] synthetase (radical SAM superfamily)